MKRALRFILGFGLSLLASTARAEETKTIYNALGPPFDYITKLDSTTLPGGSTQYINNVSLDPNTTSFHVTSGVVRGVLSVGTPDQAPNSRLVVYSSAVIHNNHTGIAGAGTALILGSAPLSASGRMLILNGRIYFNHPATANSSTATFEAINGSFGHSHQFTSHRSWQFKAIGYGSDNTSVIHELVANSAIPLVLTGEANTGLQNRDGDEAYLWDGGTIGGTYTVRNIAGLSNNLTLQSAREISNYLNFYQRTVGGYSRTKHGYIGTEANTDGLNINGLGFPVRFSQSGTEYARMNEGGGLLFKSSVTLDATSVTGSNPVLKVAGSTLVANNDGFVGIGTSAPATKLHMSSGTLTIDGTSPAMFIGGSTMAVTGGRVGVGLTNPTHIFQVTGSANVSSSMTVTGTSVSGTTSRFRVGTNDLAVTGAGNVGIGITNPSVKLHTVGAIRATTNIQADSFLKVGAQTFPDDGAVRLPNGGTIFWANGAGTGSVPGIAVNGSDQLEFGTAINLGNQSLTGTYEVGGFGVLRLHDGTGSGGIEVNNSNGSSGSFIWYGGGGTALVEMRDSSAGGHVGIGTSPTEKLHLQNGIFLQDGTNAYHTFEHVTSSPTTSATKASIWASNVAGSAEMKVKDGAGNITQISPHRPGTDRWYFQSCNERTGRCVDVDMEKLVSLVEKLSGEKIMLETFMKEGK